MRRQITLIRLNELHTIRCELPRWEVPVVQRVHTNELVLEGETTCTKRVPDPAEEYQRLDRKYGVDRDTRVPYVVSTYPTVEALADAMAPDLEEQALFDEVEAKRQEAAAAEAATAAAKGQTLEDAAIDERAGGKRAAGGKK